MFKLNEKGALRHRYYWLDETLIPNVRVQPWYNGKPPYGLRGYLDDRVNRIIGYAIVRQVREEMGVCTTAKVRNEGVECTFETVIE